MGDVGRGLETDAGDRDSLPFGVLAGVTYSLLEVEECWYCELGRLDALLMGGGEREGSGDSV